MELLGMKKVRDSRYLKNYELTYLNKAGKEKVYEIVSHRDMTDPSELGEKISGFSIAAYSGDKMLLLREFRMGVNRYVYNLCAGMIEPGETDEECIARELFEESGLKIKKIDRILPPAYAAVAISDIANRIAFVETEGTISDEHTSANEDIKARFYSSDELRRLLETEPFTSRCQIAVYLFLQLHP